MTDTSAPAKPQAGQVASVIVPVQNVWQHTTVIIATVMAIVPIVLAALIQLKDVPGLPTNILGWITSAIAVLTAIVVVWQKLHGLITITPTAAAKLVKGN